MSISRRRAVRALAGLTAALAPPMLNLGRSRVFAASAREYSHRALDLVARALVIDMLGVLALDEKKLDGWAGGAERIDAAALETFKTSGITVFHMAVGLGGPTSYEEALQFVASWNGFIARTGDHFMRVDRVADLDAAKSSGKIGVIVGLQNADQFRSAADVALFHKLGLRCAQLTYNEQNLLGSGATERVDGGVTDFGIEIIRQMNEAGMLVDVSHCGDRTTLDAIEISAGPIAITHGNCRALNDHPRLKTDEAIRKLAAKGGVMGITGVRMFVRNREPTTVEHLVDHIDHVARLAGIEHVGIGSDSDLWGADSLPAEIREQMKSGYKSSYAFREKLDTDGFNHPRKVFDLTEALIRRGYSDEHIIAVLGGNFRRLLAQVWSA